MKLALRVLSVLMILTGLVWTLQGINILPGSLMSGSTFWLVMGIIIGSIGIGLWLLADRYMQRYKGDPDKK